MSWHLVAALSYASAASAYALLAGLLLLRHGWRARTPAAFFGVVCAVTATWAALAAVGSVASPIASPAAGIDALNHVLLMFTAFKANGALEAMEALRTAAWLWLLLWLLRRLAGTATARYWWSAAVAGVAMGSLLAALAAACGAALTAAMLRLGLAVLGLLLVEHLYRSTPPSARWGIKFASLAMGALFAYDFYLYSDALLFRRVNMELWATRGTINALSAPLLALSAARNPDWKASFYVSRQILFRSVALLGAAVYLLSMAASAWYLRLIGGDWGITMQLACLFGAALLLAAVLFSGTLRAYLKVLISKHFYQTQYDYRQEWQRLTRALADEGAPLAQRAIQALADLVESPAGMLWSQRDGHGYQVLACWNMAIPLQAKSVSDSEGEAERASIVEFADGALCRYLAQRNWVIDLLQWRRKPELYGDLALPDWLSTSDNVRWVVPLMLSSRLFGFICLAQPRTELPFNWEVRDVLTIAGRQAASYLAHQDAERELAVARQFEAFNRMSTFVVHDLKNLISQLSLLLANAERHQTNPAFQRDLHQTLAHALTKMNSLLQKLRNDPCLELASPLTLDLLLAQVMSASGHLHPQPVLEVCATGLVVLANRQRLERVITQLLQNAIEATPRHGQVLLRLLQSGASAVLELRDNGHGMSEQFMRECLFQPFISTKPAGMGIGVFESREYVRELGGRLEVRSAPSQGTTFRLILPLHAAAAAA